MSNDTIKDQPILNNTATGAVLASELRNLQLPIFFEKGNHLQSINTSAIQQRRFIMEDPNVKDKDWDKNESIYYWKTFPIPNISMSYNVGDSHVEFNNGSSAVIKIYSLVHLDLFLNFFL